MLVDLGEEPTIKNAHFTVFAAIYCESINDYIHHWEGGTFLSYDEAYDCWNEFDPPKEEINAIMEKQRASGDFSHHELEIGITSNNAMETSSLAFMNTTIDLEHEKE